MRFLVSVFLLTLFSASAFAHDDKRYIYLDCKDKTGAQNITLAINMHDKLLSYINSSYWKITESGSYHNESFIYLGVNMKSQYFDGKSRKDWQTRFVINRINGFLFINHDDLRAGRNRGETLTTLQCKNGRMF